MTRFFLSVALLLFFTNHCFSQFTYAGIKASYQNVRFDKSSSAAEHGTRINDFTLDIDLIHRPFRYVGLGISTRIPFSKSFKYAFEDLETYAGNYESELETDFDNGTMYYNIESKVGITLIGRAYLDIESNYYIDLRYNINKYQESFSYDREAFHTENIKEENYSYDRDVTVKGIGFAVGTSPHISDHFYLGYSIAVDFLNSSERGFRYNIPAYFQSSNGSRVESKIDDFQISYLFSYSIGYLF